MNPPPPGRTATRVRPRWNRRSSSSSPSRAIPICLSTPRRNSSPTCAVSWKPSTTTISPTASGTAFSTRRWPTPTNTLWKRPARCRRISSRCCAGTTALPKTSPCWTRKTSTTTGYRSSTSTLSAGTRAPATTTAMT